MFHMSLVFVAASALLDEEALGALISAPSSGSGTWSGLGDAFSN